MTKGRAQTAVFWVRVRDHMGEAPLIVPPDCPVDEVVAAMTEGERTAAVIADPASEGEDAGPIRPVGILTEEDVVRRLTFRADPKTPVGEVMTAPLAVVGEHDYLYTAIARMRRLGLRHLPAVDDSGRPVGMLRLAEAYAAGAADTFDQLDALTSDGTIAGMRGSKAAQAPLAGELFADGLTAPEIQQVVTHLNNDIARRVVGLNVAAMESEGLGPPPVPFAMIVMGSGGRGENFLYPDQDNGFILEDYPDAEHARIDPWFIDLAERVTRDLDAIGIPYCPGNVMASNPLWRKTLSQWKEQVDGWVARATAQAVRNADIFLDFGWLYGERDLVAALKAHVAEATRGSDRFLQRLLHDEGAHKVALGWFNTLATDRRKPEHKGEIDLKHRGTMPIVQGVRVMALREGVEGYGTLEKIAGLESVGRLDAEQADRLRNAFLTISGLLLKTQIKAFETGGRVGNHVRPDTLSKRERDSLVRALKHVQTFRNTLRYTLLARKV